MYLNYSKIEFDKFGRPETPVLLLQTKSGTPIGTLSNVSDIRIDINFSQPSTLTFEIAASNNGHKTMCYDEVVGHKVIYTKSYGVYLIGNVEESGDGIERVKSVKAFSLEKDLGSKNLFLEENTYNFWNPVMPADTILGRCLEVAPGWSVGYVSPTLIGRFRTFDKYDDYLLSFIYNVAPEKYRFVAVFDPYQKTISAYDVDVPRPTAPIHLDFDNLVKELDTEEQTDELVTSLCPYGSDSLDIRPVNPTGSNYIYDLSYFIANGDIKPPLSDKWNAWLHSIRANQEYYNGLVSLGASATARLLSMQAKLADLNGEKDDLTNQQSVTIEAYALEKTAAGKEAQQKKLDEINKQLDAKKAEIAKQEAEISEIEATLDPKKPDSYPSQIKAISDSLAITKYFTPEEYKTLSAYIIEQSITEETFVATNIDTTISGTTSSLTSGKFKFEKSSISEVDLTAKFQKRIYSIAGGNFSISGAQTITGECIRGTLEVKQSGDFVLSIYSGSMRVADKSAPSGMISIVGKSSAFVSDVKPITKDEITTHEGTSLSFNMSNASVYTTANAGDYKKYSVQMELYDFAVETLSDVAQPTYEFDIDVGNFIFAQSFAPFRERLQLGQGIYLKLHDGTIIQPTLIEIKLRFDKPNDLTLGFSNRFKRSDNVNTLKDMLDQSYSAGRDLQASKYLYNQTANQASQVNRFMNSMIDAAVNEIKGAKNQSVTINGAGIHVGGDTPYKLRIVNSMIAMSKDDFKTAEVAIGRFATPELGEIWGVNAGLVAGRLLIGNSLILESVNKDGILQLKFDSTGTWLHNSTFVLTHDSGGKLMLDPRYGFAAGTSDLYTIEGTTVKPSFVNDKGNIVLDADGYPKNSNFFLDLKTGNAYFRGKVTATAGKIGGFTIEDTFLHGGSGSSYIALHGSGSGVNSRYAIWAGNPNPEIAPFYVTKDGDLYAKNGTFKGTISGASFVDASGRPMMNGSYEFKADYLNLNGINVGNGNFVVDSSGNVSIRGSITMAPGSSINWAFVNESNVNQSSSYIKAEEALNSADNAYDLAWKNRLNDENIFNALTNGGTIFGIFSSSTDRLYINANYIKSGTINADIITFGNDNSGFCCDTGDDGISRTYGAKMFGSDGPTGDSYVFVSNKGARMNGAGSYIYCIGKGVHASSEIAVDSDARLKSDIRKDLSKYEQLFFELQPATFELTTQHDGTRHIGLVAQDLDAARIKCNLTREDLALLEYSDKSVSGNVTDKYYSIRYGELVPLCIHMIQKLYKAFEAEFGSAK